MKFYARLALLSIAFILVFTSFAGSHVLGATESEALDAVVEAEETIVYFYGAVAEADRAGANVSVLMATLGEAGEFLSKAEFSYGRGDFDSAVDFANQSQSVLYGLVEEAEVLTENVIKENYLDFLVAVGSAIGAVSIICGGFAAWFFLKKPGEIEGAAE